MNRTRFLALLKREIERYLRSPKKMFIPPFITNILYFSVFGVILGGRIDAIQGFPYVLFILPGLVVLGTISNSFENSNFSIFHGRWNDYIDEMLTSPASYTEMVLGYVTGSAIRGLLVGVLIGIVGTFFASVSIARPFYLLAFMIVIPTLFGAIGVIGGLWAEEFDDLYLLDMFLIRPLVFFGGVFYSLDILPALWRDLSLLNPMVYMVNGVRYGLLGYTDVNPDLALAVLAVVTVAVILFDIHLFKNGYGIRE